jgi:hypothetical protein
LAEPVAWQIVTFREVVVGLPAGVGVRVAAKVGVEVNCAGAVGVFVALAVAVGDPALTVVDGVAPTVAGQPPAGAGIMSPWAVWAGSALLLTVICT